MFATGPANNCYLDLYSTDAYASLSAFKGLTTLRTIEVMLDVMLLDLGSSSNNQVIAGEAASTRWDVDNNGIVAAPLTGLSFKVTRAATTYTATPSTTTPAYGKRYTFWGRDNGSTVTALVNGAAGTNVTYTALQAADPIVTPITFEFGRFGGGGGMRMRLYEAAIRANGVLVFHVRPRLWMASSATPQTVPDLSGYGNDLAVSGGFGISYDYRASWSRQVPYSGKENFG